jgi:phage terminase large subunit-like protein
MGKSLAERFAALPKSTRDDWLLQQDQQTLEEIDRGEWWWLARPEQIPPEGDWLVHLALAGRGFGKSRAGSEWLVQRALDHPFDRSGTPTEYLIIAETLSDARLICVEGPAGILRVLDRKKMVRNRDFRYIKSPKPMIVFECGTKIYCEGADSADVGRGYNAAGAWLDEIAKWPRPSESWMEGIMPSMRADLYDDHPRVFVTTTPKPIQLIREWVDRDDGSVSVVRGSTFDNKSNLSAHVIAELEKRYAGTEIGRQELFGDLLDDSNSMLFNRSDIMLGRVDDIPDGIRRIVVGADPNLTGESDEFGVVVVASDTDNDFYVLADRSTPVSGRAAAILAWKTVAEFGADKLIYESNLGKTYLAEVLRDAYFELVGHGMFPAGSQPPMKAVDSRLGKKTRAEPVAMRYEQHRVHHVGIFETLEKQMINFNPETGKHSPDRVDALVHACRYLMSLERKSVSVMSVSKYRQRQEDIYSMSSTGWTPGSGFDY